MFPTREEYENDKITNAVYFQATQFCGRGKFLKHKTKTKVEAIEYAAKNPSKRPWMIYAVTVEGLTLHICNV
jgi:hypothetical protein|tara:strand:- start:687 stop:902 length:216 start_codon:yes stop_codon:yes gene_type:complete